MDSDRRDSILFCIDVTEDGYWTCFCGRLSQCAADLASRHRQSTKFLQKIFKTSNKGMVFRPCLYPCNFYRSLRKSPKDKQRRTLFFRYLADETENPVVRTCLFGNWSEKNPFGSWSRGQRADYRGGYHSVRKWLTFLPEFFSKRRYCKDLKNVIW